jgi:integrase
MRRSLQRNQLGTVVKEPKNKRSRRQIALAAPAMEALHRHWVRQHEERSLLGAAWEEHGLVFCRATGRPLDATSVLRRGFYRLLEHAGLLRVRFHDLRHTAATLLLGARVNPKIVSEMLGHSTVGSPWTSTRMCCPTCSRMLLP